MKERITILLINGLQLSYMVLHFIQPQYVTITRFLMNRCKFHYSRTSATDAEYTIEKGESQLFCIAPIDECSVSASP